MHPMSAEQPEAIPRRHVTGLLVAGFWVVGSSFLLLLALPHFLEADADAARATFYVMGAGYLVVGLVLLFIGARRGSANPPQPFHPVRGHTIAIALLGVVFLLLATPTDEPPEIRLFTVFIFLWLSVAAFAVAALRIRSAPLAVPATAALNIAWAILFPFGTGLFIWWLLSVRKRESLSAA